MVQSSCRAFAAPFASSRSRAGSQAAAGWHVIELRPSAQSADAVALAPAVERQSACIRPSRSRHSRRAPKRFPLISENQRGDPCALELRPRLRGRSCGSGPNHRRPRARPRPRHSARTVGTLSCPGNGARVRQLGGTARARQKRSARSPKPGAPAPPPEPFPPPQRLQAGTAPGPRAAPVGTPRLSKLPAQMQPLNVGERALGAALLGFGAPL